MFRGRMYTGSSVSDLKTRRLSIQVCRKSMSVWKSWRRQQTLKNYFQTSMWCRPTSICSYDVMVPTKQYSPIRTNPDVFEVRSIFIFEYSSRRWNTENTIIRYHVPMNIRSCRQFNAVFHVTSNLVAYCCYYYGIT